MTRFTDMLDRKAEDIKRPPLLPVGQYLIQVKKQPEQEETTGNDGTLYDVLRFPCAVVEAVEVDSDELEEYGKVAGAPVRIDFLFNTDPDENAKREGSLNRLKNFLMHLQCFEEGQTVAEGLAASPGSQCMAELSHRPDPNDPENFFLEVKRTYAPE
jgi:hypothetical protein